MTTTDPRRAVPPTNTVLADPRLVAALELHARPVVVRAVRAALAAARAGEVPARSVADEALRLLSRPPDGLRPVLNATGVVVHTNLGRAPLGPTALDAVAAASGYVDVEYDVASGRRRRRGAGALRALGAALPDAGSVMVVNNGAAALLLAVSGLASGMEVVWGRGELVEIGDGFRLHELVATAGGARLREVGSTNRTGLADYARAVGSATGCVLKVHPSNFTVSGFASAVPVRELVALGAPVVVDVGSGLLRPDPLLPDEPDVTTALRAGAALVTASGDKLLGGPQAGIIAGRAELVERLRRLPLARALRVDKLTLAALEATLAGPPTPVWQSLHADVGRLAERCAELADRVGGEVVASDGAVGGGGAPGVALPGWAVALPARYAGALRAGDPCVVTRVVRDRCLIDLRCVPEAADGDLGAAVLACR